jgi:hypothetical protein
MLKKGSLMRLVKVVFLSFVLLSILASFFTCRGSTEVTEEEYSQMIINLSASLVEFTATDVRILAQGDENGLGVDELASKRNQFASALTTIKQVETPKRFVGFQGVLTHYGGVLDAMNTMVEAMYDGNHNQILKARSYLYEQEKQVKYALDKVQLEETSSRLLPWVWIAIALGAALVIMLAILYRRSHPYQTTVSAELKQIVDGEMKQLTYCPRCGVHLKPDAKFCHKCGAPASKY